MQNSSMCEVEYIVESIPVGLGNIVQERIAYEHAIPLQMTLSGCSLHDPYLELQGKPLLHRETVVKGRQR